MKGYSGNAPAAASSSPCVGSTELQLRSVLTGTPPVLFGTGAANVGSRSATLEDPRAVAGSHANVTRSPRARRLAGDRPRGRCSWSADVVWKLRSQGPSTLTEHDSARRASRRSAEARRPSGPSPEDGVRFKSRRCCVPKGPSPSVRACHGGMPRRGRTCPGLPWGPTVPVPSLLLHGGLSETPPQPRAVFLMVCIVSGGILEITSKSRHFHHLGHISFQFTAQSP